MPVATPPPPCRGKALAYVQTQIHEKAAANMFPDVVTGGRSRMALFFGHENLLAQ